MELSQRQWLLAILLAAGVHLLAVAGLWIAQRASAAQKPVPRGVMVSLKQFDPGPPPRASAASAPVAAATPKAAEASAPAPAAAADIGPRPANKQKTEIAPESRQDQPAHGTAQTPDTQSMAEAGSVTPKQSVQPLKPDTQVTARAADITAQTPTPNASGNGAAGNSNESTQDYEVRLRAWLSRHKQYPRAARRAAIEGTVRLYMVIDQSGRVIEHRIEKSSGSQMLDRAAEQMLERASPLPRMPSSMQRNRLELVVPVNYDLH